MAFIRIKSASFLSSSAGPFRALIFKSDDTTMWFCLPGGDITVHPGDIRTFIAPADVKKSVKINIQGAANQQVTVPFGKTLSFNGKITKVSQVSYNSQPAAGANRYKLCPCLTCY